MNAKIKSLVFSITKTNILLTIIATLLISLFNFRFGVAFLVGSAIATINFKDTIKFCIKNAFDSFIYTNLYERC